MILNSILSLALILIMGLTQIASASPVSTEKLPEPLFEGIPLACYVYNAKNSEITEGNANDKALSLVEIAEKYIEQKQSDRALATLEQSLAYATNSLSTDTEKSYTLVQIAAQYGRAGQQEKALQILDRSLELVMSIYGRDKVYALVTIADGYREAGAEKKAISLLEQAISTTEIVNDAYAKGRILVAVAQIYDKMPATKTKAADLLVQDLEFTKTITNPSALARVQLEIARAYANQGKLAIATDTLNLSLKSLASSSPLVESVTLDYLASAFLEASFPEPALATTTKMSDSYGKAIKLLQIAKTFIATDKWKDAAKLTENAMLILVNLEDVAEIAQGYSESAAIYAKLGETSKAVETLKQAINYAIRAEQVPDKVAALVRVSRAYEEIGQHNRAAQTLDQSYDIALQSERKTDIPAMISLISNAYGAIADYEQALAVAKADQDIPARSQLIRLFECAQEIAQQTPKSKQSSS